MTERIGDVRLDVRRGLRAPARMSRRPTLQSGPASAGPVMPPPPESPRRLAVVWSQDELHKRTLAGRLLARHGPRLLRLAALAGLVLAVCVVVGVALAEQALHPVVRRGGPAADAAARRVAAARHASVTDVPLVARDGAVLRAWSFVPGQRSRGTRCCSSTGSAIRGRPRRSSPACSSRTAIG